MTPLALGLVLTACAPHRLEAVPSWRGVRLPADLAPHDDAQTEWWHVHARLQPVDRNADTSSDVDVSVHLFAAFLMHRTDLDRVLGVPVPLAVNPVHAAWAQVIADGRAWPADRLAWPDLLAARAAGSGLDLRHGDWRLAWESGALVARVSAGPHRIEAVLEPAGPPVLPGDAGRVELEPGEAHLWTQWDGMPTRARWTTGGRTRALEGTGFLKHQWGRIYSPEVDGFRWVSADLPDGRALAIALLGRGDLHGAPGSLAWISDGRGGVTPLDPEGLVLEPTRTWHSRRSGADWPVAWHLLGPGFDARIEALVDEAEIWAFPSPIHVAPARLSGVVGGVEMEAPAFVEQAGARVTPLRRLHRSDPPEAR